ncbi:MAG TPA: aspartyl/asparaginyl beta-hydroxylase domain-containing protein [Caulobacteraceae bacterium]|jgi:aspartyl/asparaginyl beta-hydroxylase (cupin superfamily)
MAAEGGAAEALRGAEQALRRGDHAEALRLLRGAESAAPADPEVKMQLALALRLGGDFPGALAAVERALALEPYLLMGHLTKGFLLERLGQPRQAAESYRVALKIAPPEERLPPSFKAPLARAREQAAEQTEAFDRFLSARLAPLRAGRAREDLSRVDVAQRVFAGKDKVYYPEPVNFNFPFLPPYQYHPRESFPWLAELEAATETMAAELREMLRQDREGFTPYIQYKPGEPVNQWEELNHSSRWSSFFFWKDGKRIDANCQRCPRTAALLERMPMTDQPGYAPTAMFSSLEPRTRIPPHTGSVNTRLIVHLPLILPGQCFFRVGNETREWRMGEAWVFDDTIEHEAWNDSGEERIILIFDVWNPHLTGAERELVTALLDARRDYMAG